VPEPSYSTNISLTYHSNAIEGNTLTLRETQIVIEEGITIAGHSLREHLRRRTTLRPLTFSVSSSSALRL
jgi:Fic family protein